MDNFSKLNFFELRNIFLRYMDEYFPEFEYKKHGANIGLWETNDSVHLVKPINDSISPAKFRILIFLPNRYGISVKVEMFPHSVYEWECVFEGYIEKKEDIERIFNFQLGLKECDRITNKKYNRYG